MKKKLTLIILIFLCCMNSFAHAKTIRALFLGNSYTQSNNLPELIHQLALSVGDTLIYNSNTPGGYTLKQHSTNNTSLSLIAQGNWDFVILQEQSQLPSFPDQQVETEVYPYAELLNNLIIQSNPCAKTIFFVTWGRKNGDTENCQFFPPLCTYEGMDDLLQLRYTVMAENNKAVLSPVAMTWRELRNENPEIELYTADESHPNSNGSFVAACTFYATMFEKDPMESSYNYSLNTETASTIKSTVKAIVYENIDFWYRFFPFPEAHFDYSVNNNSVQFTNQSENAENFFWSFGDGATSQEENPLHSYTENGEYEVELIVSKCGTNDIYTQTIVIQSMNINDSNDQSDIFVFPNPFSETCYIRTPKKSNGNFKLFDLLGKEQNIYINKQNDDFLIITKKLPSGIYFLQYENQNKKFSTKLIKK